MGSVNLDANLIHGEDCITSMPMPGKMLSSPEESGMDAFA